MVGESNHEIPSWVKVGLNFDGARGWYIGSRVFITRRNRDGTLTHFSTLLNPHSGKCNPGRDADGTYRSGHAKLFRAVNGHWPDQNSHANWFGWAWSSGNANRSASNMQFQGFSCTLNTPDGWKTDKAADQREKVNLNDLMKRRDHERLLQDFKDVFKNVPMMEIMIRFVEENYELCKMSQEAFTLTDDLRLAVKWCLKQSPLIHFKNQKLTELQYALACRLFQGAIKGNNEMIKEALDSGIDVNVGEDIYDRQAINFATEKDNLEAVLLLLERGATYKVPRFKTNEESARCIEAIQLHSQGEEFLE